MKAPLFTFLLMAATIAILLLGDRAADKGGVLARCEIEALQHDGNSTEGRRVTLCMREAGYERRDENAGCRIALPRDLTTEDTLRQLIKGEASECYSPATVVGQIGVLRDCPTLATAGRPPFCPASAVRRQFRLERRWSAGAAGKPL